MLSSVSSRIVIHLTNAKDVKENTNVMQAAAAIDGSSKGAPQVPYPRESAPAVREESQLLLETRVHGGEQWLAESDVEGHVEPCVRCYERPEPCSLIGLMFAPWTPTSVSTPIAAMMDGTTNGSVSTARIQGSNGHL